MPPVNYFYRAYPRIKQYGKIATKGDGKYEKKSYKSWTISDEFWKAVKEEIPERQQTDGKIYKRKPGGGRKALSKRRVSEGIFYVLRTGCRWKAVPKEYGAASSIYQDFQEWAATGFFERIWSKGLEKYDELEVNGCSVKI